MSIQLLASRLQRRWRLVLLSVCALFSIAAAAGWTATVTQVSDINPRSGAYPYLPTAIGDDLYFYANVGPDHQLFRTRNGETTQLTHVYSDSIGIRGDYMPFLPPARAGSAIFFASVQMWTDSGTRPYEIWRVNEALPAGAELVWRSPGAVPRDWASVGGLLYILIRNAAGQMDLWATDGTDAGLWLVQEGLVDTSRFSSVGPDAAYVFARSPQSAPVTWYDRIDANGVTPLDTLGVMSNGYKYYSAVLQDDFYVTNSQRVVRVPAGSTQGELVLDGGWDAQIQQMHALGGKLFFVDAANPYTGPEFVLWRYDPAQDQLQRIGAYSSPIAGLTAMGDSVYFVINRKDDTPARLMRLPNASATAFAAATLGEGDLVDGNSPSIAATDSMLYMQVTINRGWELWGSDGTAGGTRSISRLWDYDQDSQFNNCPCLAVAGDTLYFDRMARPKWVEMWRVDVAETPSDPHHLYLPQIKP